jgi:hypothetical protein
VSPEPPEDAGFTPPLFSESQVDALVEFIVAHGRARAQAQGSNFSETDYLAGAMAWFFALKMNSKIPARWIFDTFSGRSPLDVEVPDAQVYVVITGRRQATAVYRDRHLAQEHVDQLWREGDDNAFVAQEYVRTQVMRSVQDRTRAYDEDEAVKDAEKRWGA